MIADQTAQQADARRAEEAQIDENLATSTSCKRRAYGRAQTAAARYTGPIPAVSRRGRGRGDFAYNAIGTPYVWAGDEPERLRLLRADHGRLGRRRRLAAAQRGDAVERLPHICRPTCAPGDLVFYSGLDHVGIYVGDGQIIHAPDVRRDRPAGRVDMMPPYGYARPG